MGYDACAKLCFGVEFSRGDVLPWDEHEEVETWWAQRHGVPTWEEFKRNPANSAKSYFKEVQDLLNVKPCPVGCCTAGYEGENIIYHVPGTYYCSPDWGSEAVDVEALKVDPQALQNFLAFFEEQGVVLPKQPSWLLSVYYG